MAVNPVHITVSITAGTSHIVVHYGSVKNIQVYLSDAAAHNIQQNGISILRDFTSIISSYNVVEFAASPLIQQSTINALLSICRMRQPISSNITPAIMSIINTMIRPPQQPPAPPCAPAISALVRRVRQKIIGGMHPPDFTRLNKGNIRKITNFIHNITHQRLSFNEVFIFVEEYKKIS